MFFFILILIFCQFLQTNEVEANVCSQIFIAPMFSKHSGINYMSSLLRVFVSSCAVIAENLRKTLIVFDFTKNITTTCLHINTGISASQLGTLDKFGEYPIESKLKQQINEYDGCLNKSLLLILTDIRCSDFYQYPDVDNLFGHENINETLSFLLEKQLQTYFIFVKNFEADKTYSQIEPCEYMSGLKFKRNSNYFQLHIPEYEPRIFVFKPNETNICSSTIPEVTDPKVLFDPENYIKVIVSICSGAFFALLIFFVAFWVKQIHRRWKESKIEEFADAHTKSARHILFGKYLDEWEVTPKELKVDQEKILGRGAFGIVYKGHLKKKRNDEWIEMDVAVKFPHIDANETVRKEMIYEIGFLKALGNHDNLLVMVGYVKSIENPVICTVFCEKGDLLGILRQHPLHFMSSEKCQEVEICLLLPDLLRISLEVCNGLCYLSSFNYIHRDIAARNVLLTDNLQAKLSDFGLCKKLEFDQKILTEKDGKLPIKYLPHESLKFGEFSEKSDVWSFGIFMWEMFSGGMKPFDNVPIENFVCHLESGGKPDFSRDTPEQLLKILNDHVFQLYPSKRKSFVELKQELEQFYFIVLSVVS